MPALIKRSEFYSTIIVTLAIFTFFIPWFFFANKNKCKFSINFFYCAKPKFNTYLLVYLIIFYKIIKLILIYYDLIFELNISNFINLMNEKNISDKQNIFGFFYLFDVISGPLLIYCLLIENFKRNLSFFWGISILLIYEIVSLQTGRFQIISYFFIYYGMLKLLKCENISIRLCLIFIVIAFLFFPVLHAIRSGDLFSDYIEVFSSNYFFSVLTSDVSPGLNFFDLVDYVDTNGYNYFYYLLIAPLQFIPRILWSAKPITSAQADYTNLIYGIDHLEGVSFTFTFFDSYSYIGLISLLIFTAIYSFLLLRLYKFFIYSNKILPLTKISVAFLLINSFNFYRGAILDFLAPILIGVAIPFLLDKLLFVKSYLRK